MRCIKFSKFILVFTMGEGSFRRVVITLFHYSTLHHFLVCIPVQQTKHGQHGNDAVEADIRHLLITQCKPCKLISTVLFGTMAAVQILFTITDMLKFLAVNLCRLQYLFRRKDQRLCANLHYSCIPPAIPVSTKPQQSIQS